MRNDWTGGQYSLLRAGFGLWLVGWFAHLAGGEGLFGGWPSWLLAGLGAVCGLALVVGRLDRAAALIAIGCLAGLGEESSIVLVWPLLAHAMIRLAPYGSLAAVGRVDPGGGWRLPRGIFATTWAVTGLLLLWPLLGSPPHPLVTVARIGWLPLAPFRRARPWIWGIVLLSQAGQTLWLRSADELALLVLLSFAFDPGWIRPASPGASDLVFYDGGCGLCHRFVRFLLAEDRGGRFVFAPLFGETFRDRVPVAERQELPDSIVVQRPDRRLITRSDAALHALARLGGVWRALAVASRLFPLRLRDAVYDFVARIRYGLFARPADSCPLLPEELRDRMLP